MTPKKRPTKNPTRKTASHAPAKRRQADRGVVNTSPRHPGFVRIMKVEPDAVLPTRAHADDAGMDLYSLEDLELVPGQGKVVKTGIAIALPEGYVGFVADRSSLGKKGVKTAGGVIDAGYRGQIHIVMWNVSNSHVELRRHERIAQLLILPVATPAIREVDPSDAEFRSETLRGERGFGSTGK